jgi:hypothetical protein
MGWLIGGQVSSPALRVLGRWVGIRWSGMGQRGQSGVCVGGLLGPGLSVGDLEDRAAGGANLTSCDTEQTQLQPFRLSDAMAPSERKALGEGDQVGGQRADLQQHLVLGEVLKRQVAQPGVFADADASPGVPGMSTNSRSAS